MWLTMGLNLKKKINYILEHKKILLVLLFLLTVLIRAPNISREYYSVDTAAMYYDVADNIKDGKGFIATHRFYYFDNNDDIVHDSSNTVGPLYPIYLSLFLFFKDSLSSLIFANILLMGLLVVLVYLFAERLFGQTVGLVSALFIMLNGQLYALSIFVWSEPITLVFLILTFYFTTFGNKNRYWVLCGVFGALTYLSRYNGGIAILSIWIWLLIRRDIRQLIIMASASLLIALPWFIRSYLKHGTFFYFPLAQLVKTENAFVAWNYYPLLNLESMQFPISKLLWLAVGNFLNFIGLLGTLDLFSFLFAFLLVGFITYRSNEKIQPIIIFSILFFLIQSLNFHQEHSRHILFIYVLGVPIAVATMKELTDRIHIGKASVFIVLSSTLLFTYIVIDSGQMYYNKGPRLVEEKDAYSWLSKNSHQESNIASTFPADVNYFTRLKTTLIPNKNTSVLSDFIGRYNISYFVLEKTNQRHEPYTTNATRLLYRGNNNVIIGKYSLKLAYTSGSVLIYRVDN